jgi:hypothetical protein
VDERTGKTQVEKSLAYATEVGDSTYASWTRPGAGAWAIVFYDMPDRDTLRVRLMDPERVAREVEAGHLAGRVERKRRQGSEGEEVTVHLASPTGDLRRWLAERGKNVFADHAGTLRRVR